jgi:glucose-6-phosphate 1-epimerase
MATASIADLNRRFGIPGVAEVVEGNGGLAKIQITTSVSAGEIYLHGAHLTSWKPKGAQEVFFVSSHTLWQDGKAIRGGIPICFPWFGDKADDPQAPAHGFVRTKAWQLESIAREGDAVSVAMVTESGDSTRKWWPFDFRLVYRATFGVELTLELIMANTGDQALRFEEALHAYHNVDDSTQAHVGGLEGADYLDKTDSYRRKTQIGDVVITAETDRVYLNTAHPITLSDHVLQRGTTVTKENSLTTVVWNPWSAKAPTMADLGADQWKRMLCIETSNVGDFAVDLPPGEQHVMKAIISVQ